MLSPAVSHVRVGVLSLADKLAGERYETRLRFLGEIYQLALVNEAQAMLDHYKERHS